MSLTLTGALRRCQSARVSTAQESDLYFRQIPLGPMANFIYLIGSRRAVSVVIMPPLDPTVSTPCA